MVATRVKSLWEDRERRYTMMKSLRVLVLFGLVALPLSVLASDDAPAADVTKAPVSPVASALARADAAAAAIVAVPNEKRTFENTLGAIDDLLSRLNGETSMAQFMAYVSTDATEREMGEKSAEDVANWLITFSKRKDIFDAVKAYADTKPPLSGERARLLQFVLRDFKRDGMMLSDADRARLTDVQKEITRLGIEFERNIREDATTLFFSARELGGMPEEFLKNLPQSRGMYEVNMSYPQYIPVQEMCEVEATRQKMWLAYKRRGGEKNVGVLEQILKLRAEQATLLGFANAADFETEVLMSKSASNVASFYAQLTPLVRKKAEIDFAELQNLKRTHLASADAALEPWDYSYYKTRLLKEKYSVDPEVVRQYFPMQSVVDGLFEVTQRIYGLTYRDVTAEASQRGRHIWHEDVKLYEVTDTASGKVLGEFYIDLYPRPNKYNHAAQWGLLEHKIFMDGTEQKPLAALVCNFTKPTDEAPSLMTHDEVETFFHEFGHCLHTIVSEANLGRFSGTSVERDFVEAPSQMFENWVWNADVLNLFAKHYKTGEPLPKSTLDGMIAAQKLASGMDAQNQIFYGLTDQRYHSTGDGVVDTIAVQAKTFEETTMFKSVPETFFQASFGHLVGYQAGYYGYMWSLVYASDMFTRFKKEGLLNPEVGLDYRRKVISQGGTKDGLDLVRDFLGREPDMRAFLEHLGLSEAK